MLNAVILIGILGLSVVCIFFGVIEIAWFILMMLGRQGK